MPADGCDNVTYILYRPQEDKVDIYYNKHCDFVYKNIYFRVLVFLDGGGGVKGHERCPLIPFTHFVPFLPTYIFMPLTTLWINLQSSMKNLQTLSHNS